MIKIQKHHLIKVKTHLNTTLIGLIKDKQARIEREKARMLFKVFTKVKI